MKYHLLPALLISLVASFPLRADDQDPTAVANAVQVNLANTPEEIRTRILSKTGNINEKSAEMTELLGSASHGFTPEFVNPNRIIPTFLEYKAFAGLLLLSFQPRADGLIADQSLVDDIVLCRIQVADTILNAHHFWDAEAQLSDPSYFLRPGDIIWNNTRILELAQVNRLLHGDVVNLLLESGFASAIQSCPINSRSENDRELVYQELLGNFLAKQP